MSLLRSTGLLLLALTLTGSKEGCSSEQPRATSHFHKTLVCTTQQMWLFGLLHAIRARFVPDRTARAVVANKVATKHTTDTCANSSRRNTIHHSRERTTPRDLESNLSQMSHSVSVRSQLVIFICKELKRHVAFGAVLLRPLSAICLPIRRTTEVDAQFACSSDAQQKLTWKQKKAVDRCCMISLI